MVKCSFSSFFTSQCGDLMFINITKFGPSPPAGGPLMFTWRHNNHERQELSVHPLCKAKPWQSGCNSGWLVDSRYNSHKMNVSGSEWLWLVESSRLPWPEKDNRFRHQGKPFPWNPVYLVPPDRNLSGHHSWWPHCRHSRRIKRSLKCTKQTTHGIKHRSHQVENPRLVPCSTCSCLVRRPL